MSSSAGGKRLRHDQVSVLLAVLDRVASPEAVSKMPIWDGENGIVKQLGLKDKATAQGQFQATVAHLQKLPGISSTNFAGNPSPETPKAQKGKKREVSEEAEGKNPLLDELGGLLVKDIKVDEIEGLFDEMESGGISRHKK